MTSSKCLMEEEWKRAEGAGYGEMIVVCIEVVNDKDSIRWLSRMERSGPRM